MGSKFNAVVVAGLTVLAAPALAQEAIGVVKRAAGEVRIERDGTQFAPARGLEVKRGDHVTTGQDGYILVALHGTASSVGIGPDADVSLDRFAPAAASSQSQAQASQRPWTGLLERLASFFAINRQRN